MLDTVPSATVDRVLADLDAALAQGEPERAAALFEEGGFWRDLVSFTWNIRTLEGQEEIAAMLRDQLGATRPRGWRVTPGEEVEDAGGVIEAWIDFETEAGRGHGHIRIRDGRIWTLLTTLTELKGHEERRGTARPRGVVHGADPNRKTWAEARAEEQAALGRETQPYVVIVGAGQGGLALGAQLRQLDVPTIIVEKNPRPGDSWRRRYKSLCLHDPVWYDHMPYIPFPENWPVFAPKDKIGDWLEMYARVMKLNVWTSSAAERAVWNETAGEWELRVRRDGEEIVLLRPRHLVLATGMAGKPNLPVFPGRDIFEGEQHHSSQHPGPDAYAGRRVVVIGSNNSAHDICAALWEAGADVTMVQRSSTHVVRSEQLMRHGLGPLYSEEAVARGITTDKADLLSASVPYRLMASMQKPIYEGIRTEDAAFYEGLEKAGFLHDWGDDDSGLTMKYLRRGSGYYIDVGASQLIIEGKIKLHAGADVERLTAGSVVLTDGTELPAYLVVYATGYGSMNGWAAELISQEVADRVGKCWGHGSDTTKDPGPWEGEQRNMWKPTAQEALWFHGGNLHQSRHYSQFLALQLKARQAGIPTPVWGMGPVHHLS